MNRFLALFCATFLFGCATSPSPQAQKIVYANETMMKDCQYLGPIHGSSSVGGAMSATGVNNARNEALESAVAMNATHVVNKSASGGWGSTFMGEAYKCD
ncbi:hypothetical protein AB6E53_02190 [Vibrio breoganii]|uniref:DUF4156 domain-containing protein n=1 Tax=Vibrio breoganii TaxID=553239 RepID=A0AAP8SWX5_9VIBR|nr:hypothetical protein [Vibrio breoganii]PMP10197.1 hypothetical protein BCS93_11010 [Vibrio breoganii]